LLLLLLLGLPVLSLLQLLGGVDPNLVAAGYAVLVLTMFSLAAVGILVSVYAHRSRSALMGVYLAVLAYLVLSWLFQVMLLEMMPREIGLKELPKYI
jgi:ABC-type transport system involved in multi-copper enzyme maturation permease subunit